MYTYKDTIQFTYLYAQVIVLCTKFSTNLSFLSHAHRLKLMLNVYIQYLIYRTMHFSQE